LVFKKKENYKYLCSKEVKFEANIDHNIDPRAPREETRKQGVVEAAQFVRHAGVARFSFW
jgi:hypothetical protein